MLELGGARYDEVTPADFPERTLRYRNPQAARDIGLDAIAYQPPERGHLGSVEGPADVHAARFTERDLPRAAWEPRPHGRGIAFGRAAGRRGEARHDEAERRRIHELVLVRAVDRDARPLGSKARSARGAAHPSLLLRRGRRLVDALRKSHSARSDLHSAQCTARSCSRPSGEALRLKRANEEKEELPRRRPAREESSRRSAPPQIGCHRCTHVSDLQKG